MGDQIRAVRRTRAESIDPNFNESIGESFADNSDAAHARARHAASSMGSYQIPLETEITDELEGLEPLSAILFKHIYPEKIDWKHYLDNSGWVHASIYGFIDGRLLLGWQEPNYSRVTTFVLQRMKFMHTLHSYSTRNPRRQ